MHKREYFYIEAKEIPIVIGGIARGGSRAMIANLIGPTEEINPLLFTTAAAAEEVAAKNNYDKDWTYKTKDGITIPITWGIKFVELEF